MNVTWLYGDEIRRLAPNGCAMWRQDYDTWIKETKQDGYGHHPVFVICACRSCGWVEETGEQASQCANCGQSCPYYAKFGEHERSAVEYAAERWQKEVKARLRERMLGRPTPLSA